ncbi:unnamed protein product [Haemonchus placei]|uniref:Secreted protein n=1 Tax=Haemonchus placei TaxID=6290 RepID=A0A0N4VS73_HAEPC|nr:unnamed protein product [Haemonchus placei]
MSLSNKRIHCIVLTASHVANSFSLPAISWNACSYYSTQWSMTGVVHAHFSTAARAISLRKT